LSISKNNTFRHIQKYIKPFPYQTLRSAIENTERNVREIQNDWSPQNFRRRFEEMLDNFQFEDAPVNSNKIELPIKKEEEKPNDFLSIVKSKLRRLSKIGGLKGKNKAKKKDSYSQFGEDVIIAGLLDDLAIKNISYLDIGANNPQFISNTYLFYERGASGVLVEPNAFLCEKLRAERPRDTVLNVGIGTSENVKEADFYQFPAEADGLSTFSAAEAKHWETVGLNGKQYKVEQVLKMPLLNVNDVIANHFTECPDFVSIDVEGWDLQILKTFDFERCNPAVFCVETLAYRDDGSTYRLEEIGKFFESVGYFSFHETYANNIFVNKNLYDFYLYQKNNRAKSE
jgi:FkbM family methyltransferase